jgi:uncharacterized membrane-anchored protein YhcB (DUF1043 family)
MPSLRITAVAALATAALVVPATASAQNGVHVGTIGTPTQLKVNLPAESEWSFCANEGARCEFSGTRQVRYGANGKFTLPRTVTGGVACDNATFGDIAPNVVKQCQVTGGSQMKDEAATAAAISQPAASSAPACGPTAAQQAKVTDEIEQLKTQLAQGKGDIVAVAKTIAEIQQAVSAQTLPQQGALSDADRKMAVEQQAREIALAQKAAQQAAQSQGNLSSVEQAFAEMHNFFTGIFAP